MNKSINEKHKIKQMCSKFRFFISREFFEIIISIFLITLISIYYLKSTSYNSIINILLLVMTVVFIYIFSKKVIANLIGYNFEYRIWIEGFIFLPLLYVISSIYFPSYYILLFPPFTEKVKNSNLNDVKIDKMGSVGIIVLIIVTICCVPFFESPFIKVLAIISIIYASSNLLPILNFDGAKILSFRMYGKNFNYRYFLFLIILLNLYSWLVLNQQGYLQSTEQLWQFITGT